MVACSISLSAQPGHTRALSLGVPTLARQPHGSQRDEAVSLTVRAQAQPPKQLLRRLDAVGVNGNAASIGEAEMPDHHATRPDTRYQGGTRSLGPLCQLAGPFARIA